MSDDGRSVSTYTHSHVSPPLAVIRLKTFKNRSNSEHARPIDDVPRCSENLLAIEILYLDMSVVQIPRRKVAFSWGRAAQMASTRSSGVLGRQYKSIWSGHWGFGSGGRFGPFSDRCKKSGSRLSFLGSIQ